jgi:hypothetical protein
MTNFTLEKKFKAATCIRMHSAVDMFVIALENSVEGKISDFLVAQKSCIHFLCKYRSLSSSIRKNEHRKKEKAITQYLDANTLSASPLFLLKKSKEQNHILKAHNWAYSQGYHQGPNGTLFPT